MHETNTGQRSLNNVSFAEALKKVSDVTKPKQNDGNKPVKAGKEKELFNRQKEMRGETSVQILVEKLT